MPKIFISYRRRDSSHVSGRIYDIFADQFGRENVLKDIDNIRAGIDFRDEIARLLEACDVVVAVVGPQWLGVDPTTNTRRIDEVNDPVRVEIEFVVKRGIPIIPILFDGMTMEGLKDLPESIATFIYRNGFEIRADPYFRADMDLVVRRIKTDFASEADREHAAMEERLAQLERERKLASDRRRLQELEEEKKQQIETEQRRLIEMEEERKRQEAADIKARAEANFKQKMDFIDKQRNGVFGGIIILVACLGAALGGFIGYTLWATNFHRFGGAFVMVVLAVVLAVVGAIAGIMSGGVLGSGVVGARRAAIVTVVGTVAGTVYGVLKGLNTNHSISAIIIGLGLGFLASAFVFGIVGWIMRDGFSSPWYAKERITIPKEERVQLPVSSKQNSTQSPPR